MEVQSDYVETAKSALAFQNFSYYNKSEDSGYHTSYTPGSLECTNLSSDFLDQSLITRTPYIDQIQVGCRFTPEMNIRPSRMYSNLKHINESCIDTPPVKRAAKRPHPSAEPAKQKSSIPTPTTFIAGKIQSLEVNETNKENTSRTSDNYSNTSQSIKRYMCRLSSIDQTIPYPVTPVKRNCKSSPCRKSAKKLDFAIHTLSCEKSELQVVRNQEPWTTPPQPILARPDQKIDILYLLHQCNAGPPIQNIFRYLSIQDSCNFCLVSPEWDQVWREHTNDVKKLALRVYKKCVKENQENNLCAITLKANVKPYDGCLKEIHNEIVDIPVNQILNSPPRTPRTNRFRQFMKCASLDLRTQFPCVRCCQPAKITEEATGEKWAECTNTTCGYQYCRFCNSDRHPGKSCVQYDLNAPSPSKRKKCENAIGTKKSKKNLRRLL